MTTPVSAPRFENSIRIEYAGNSAEFIPKPKALIDTHIRRVFTGHEIHATMVEGLWKNLNKFWYWYINNAELGSMVMAEVDYYEPYSMPPTPFSISAKRVISGYAAFTFDGKTWQPWRQPRDVNIHRDTTDGLEIVITGLRGVKLVNVNSRGNRHELIAFEHALDYCAGKRSLVDILALVEMEERRRLYKERQMVYERLLVLARKLKGAVHSKTAAQIEELLMELAGKNLPF